MKPDESASRKERSDLHDLTPAEVASMPLWARCCYFVQPFNAGGRREFRSIQDWAKLFFFQSPTAAGDAADEVLRLMDFLKAESAAAVSERGSLTLLDKAIRTLRAHHAERNRNDAYFSNQPSRINTEEIIREYESSERYTPDA